MRRNAEQMSEKQDPANETLSRSDPATTNGDDNGYATAEEPTPSQAVAASVERNAKGQFTVGNPGPPKRQPVNVHRRRELQDAYTRDYAPASEHARGMCKRKAAIDETLERCRLGTPEHQRLEQLSRDLASQLEAQRTALTDTATTAAIIDAMSEVELLDRMRQLTRRLESIITEEKGHAKAVETADVFDSSPIVTAPPAESPAPAPPDPICRYCRHPQSRCVDTKTRDLELWRILHYDDPSEEKRRADIATAEMFESLRRQHARRRF
jgi:hypothetical protein